MILFDGYAVAWEREAALARRLAERGSGQPITIAAIVFTEDAGSVLYTRLKQEAAARLGIGYTPHEFSLADSVEKIRATILQLNQDSNVIGIIVQKPWRKTWERVRGGGANTTGSAIDVGLVKHEYQSWWHAVMDSVAVAKDVDGLHPQTLQAIADGIWQAKGYVLPATCQAVLIALEAARAQRCITISAERPTIAIIGKSDLVGIPLYHVLQHQPIDGLTPELLGTAALRARCESGQNLFDACVVVSCTGQPGVITGDLLQPDTVVIDVGEPQPDVELATVSPKASFLTPVPGGIGPLTVMCLMENAVQLASTKAT